MKRQKKLINRLFSTYLLVTVVSLLIVTWYVLGTLHDFFIQETRTDLVARAQLVKEYIQAQPLPLDPATVDRFCEKAGLAAGTRITIIRPTGKVVGDTRKAAGSMDSHANRPEIIAALQTGQGSAIRYSNTLGRKMMYVAIPVRDQDQVRLLIRTSVPLASVSAALGEVKTQIISAGLVVALLVVAASFLMARTIVRPVREMKAGAERFAAGDLQRKLPVPETEELAVLTGALNDMAAHLDSTIKLIQRQKNELETVFASMTEAVIAVDSDQKILRLNRAAEDFLDSTEERLQGKFLYEVIRNHAFARFAEAAVNTPRAQHTEDDIVFETSGSHYIVNTQSAPLIDEIGQRLGTLLVLTDVTRVRRLEAMRKEFAANVSHEIRTPLTAIQGFAEALVSDPDIQVNETARRHLDIVLKNSERLTAIVEDVLRLSHIEHGNRHKDFHFMPTRLGAVIDSAVHICRPQAEKKSIHIHTDCDTGLMGRIDFSLLEQALINLLTNAITYTPDNGEITISAAEEKGKAAICVRDTGIGIEAAHIPRLFERFYRVDKARSRKLGGTGLGLAIVKHVVQIHGGTIDVRSTPGRGSVFTICLPLAENSQEQ